MFHDVILLGAGFRPAFAIILVERAGIWNFGYRESRAIGGAQA